MDSRNHIESAKQIFSEFLSAKKMRQTQERMMVLEAVYKQDGLFDMEQLLESIPARNRVSKATLYNTIPLLLGAQLLISHQFQGFVKYERSLGSVAHHHMVCSQCGKITEFQSEGVQRAVFGAKMPRFSPARYSLTVYGLCSRCERQNKKKKTKKTSIRNNEQQG